MNPLTPALSADCSTSRIAPRSWNFIACWRAFSSEKWLIPKNWLSPKRMRSTSAPVDRRGAGICLHDRRGKRRWPVQTETVEQHQPEEFESARVPAPISSGLGCHAVGPFEPIAGHPGGRTPHSLGLIVDGRAD